jgi:hypothetical protein
MQAQQLLTGVFSYAWNVYSCGIQSGIHVQQLLAKPGPKFSAYASTWTFHGAVVDATEHCCAQCTTRVAV